MAIDDLPPMEMVPGRRILVVDDLGPVRKGDHVVIVANVVVALDTSRRPDDVRVPEQPNTDPSERRQAPLRIGSLKRQKYGAHAVNSDDVMAVLREHAPITSVRISDRLGLERHDLGARGKVSRILKDLIDQGIIDRVSEDGVRLYRYELVKADSSTA